MRESREQIANHIKQYRAEDVKLLYELMVRILLGNNDFRLIEKADRDDLLPVIEKETGKTIDYQVDTIIGKEALKIFKKIEEIEFSEIKLKKAQRVELMVDVLADDALFEGFCLTFYNSSRKVTTSWGELKAYFKMEDVDEYYYRNAPVLHMSNQDCAAYSIARSEKYPLITDAHCCHSLQGPGTVGFNAGHIWNVDSTDPISISKAIMEGRELAHQYQQGLKEYLPETFGASYLVNTAPVVGVRESRRILGEYVLTYEDYMERRTFPDEIGRNCYFLDVHLTKEERDKLMRGESNGEEGFQSYGPGESHGIPYGSLIPKEVNNGIGMTKTRAEELLSRRQSEHYGLFNVQERIKLYFGENYGVTIDSEPGAGTKVTFRLGKTVLEE